MLLLDGELNKVYKIKSIETDDEELNDFLFTLGCYPEKNIVIVSKLSKNIVISILDARYTIDTELASAIVVE